MGVVVSTGMHSMCRGTCWMALALASVHACDVMCSCCACALLSVRVVSSGRMARMGHTGQQIATRSGWGAVGSAIMMNLGMPWLPVTVRFVHSFQF